MLAGYLLFPIEELRSMPVQAHPLAKWQLVTALIWAFLTIPILHLEEKTAQIFLLISMIPFFTMSILTMRIGWLQLIKNQMIIYPFQNFGFSINRLLQGRMRIRDSKANWGNPGILRMFGFLNLICGSLCALLALFFAITSVLGCPFLLC
jgi:hypothetical protein